MDIDTYVLNLLEVIPYSLAEYFNNGKNEDQGVIDAKISIFR
jgi:hypothetical protein